MQILGQHLSLPTIICLGIIMGLIFWSTIFGCCSCSWVEGLEGLADAAKQTVNASRAATTASTAGAVTSSPPTSSADMNRSAEGVVPATVSKPKDIKGGTVKEGFTGANLNNGQSAEYAVGSEPSQAYGGINVKKWEQPNL